MRVITYYCEESQYQPAWVGNIEFDDGSRLDIWFTGETKDQVIAKAEAFYERERRRSRGVPSPVDPWSDNNAPTAAASLVNNEPRVATVPSQAAVFNSDGSGRGAHFGGTVWLANRELKLKKRVPAEQVDELIKQGWFRAGPRTVI